VKLSKKTEAKLMTKTKGLSTVLMNLQNAKRDIPALAIDALLKGGRQIQTTAKQFAPVDKGNLEHAIKVHEDVTPKRASITVFVDESTPTDRPGVVVGDYALAMHEDFYSPGPRSQDKAASLGVVVGRKYLERALRAHRPAITAALRSAIKKALK
jgi:hypothetical protein